MYQTREITADFTTRAEEGNQYIEGYFAVFDSEYNIGPGLRERIDPHAFDNTIGGDIRCLTNHDTTLVLGRTTAGTCELRTDDHGLFGRVLINPNDSDAVNTKARVDRRDVSQASFGFDILSEDPELQPDGSTLWTIREVKLYEVSVVTFPAYEETAIFAANRSKQAEDLKRRSAEAWKLRMNQKLRGETEDA